MRKRLFAFALCLLVVIPVSLYGCGDKTGTSTTAATQAPVSTEELEMPLDLPEVKYTGEKFKIIGQGSSGWNAGDVLMPENERGEVLNDAKLLRYTSIEEMYGIEIETFLNDNVYNAVQTSIKANDRGFDLIFMDTINSSKGAVDDLLMDLNSIDNIRLDKPWYDDGYIKGMSIGNKVFSAVTDMTTIDTHCTWILMYNKAILKRYDLTDPYDYVMQNQWTMDTFKTMLANMSVENGDGVWDENDQYALGAHSGSARNFFYGCGMRITQKNEADYPELVIDNNDSIVSLIPTLTGILHEDNTTLFGGKIVESFESGKMLFLAEIAGYLGRFRDMKDDFGIVPYPKLNAQQDRYYTTNDPCIMVMSIPNYNYSGNQLEKTAIITESLCWKSYYTVRPAYYEDVLGGKQTRDEASFEMINLCKNSRVYDFGLFNDLGSMSSIFSSLLARNANYTSLVKRQLKPATTRLNDIIATYEASGE